MRIPPRFLVPALLLALLAAPSRARSEDAPPSSAAAPEAGRITLLEAGAEPRRVLRLKVPAGQRETLALGMDMKMGGIVDVTIPRITMKMAQEVTQVTPEGTVHAQVRFDGVDVAPSDTLPEATIEAMKAIYEQLKGVRIALVTTSRGQLVSFEATYPEGLAEEVRKPLQDSLKSVRDMGPVFLPEEAVGVGARWQVESSVLTSGIQVKQTAIYRLVRSEGDAYELESGVALTADPQPLSLPGVPAGVDVALKKMEGKGSGTVAFDLKQLQPLKGSVAITVDQSMRIGQGDDAQDMDQTVEITMTLAGAIVPATPK